MKRNVYLTWLAGALLAACAAPKSPSGFLENYDQLTPNPKAKSRLAFIRPDADLQRYDRLIIDPIEVRPLRGSAAASLDEITKRRAADGFRRILMEAIDPYYSVVTEPGVHVLRVRLAITDVTESGEEGSVGVGGAAMEAELLDSMTGARLAAVVDRITGSKQGSKAPKKWRNVEGAFREWAKRLLDYLDAQG